MSQAQSHDEALIDFEEAMIEEGGPATYIDIVAGTYDPDTGETTDDILTPHTISVLPLELEGGWLSSGLVTNINVVFMASVKQIRDLGITVEAGEKITFNDITYLIGSDMPYLAGKGAIGHRFICTVA